MRPASAPPPLANGLSTLLGTALLVQACPRSLIDATLAASQAGGQRERALPAWAVVYCVMALALWPQAPAESVLQALGDGLEALAVDAAPDLLASKSALSQARSRLGAEPMRQLAQQLLGSLAAPKRPETCYRQLQVLSLERRQLAMPDTPANASHFGYPAPRQALALPHARLLLLVQGGTRSVAAAAAGPCSETLRAQAERFLAQTLRPGTLVLAGDDFDDPVLLRSALGSTASIVWQIKARHRPAIERLLPDGSYLGTLSDSREPATGTMTGMPVRVIGYTLQEEGVRPRDATFLITNLLQPEWAPVLELVALHRQVTTGAGARGMRVPLGELLGEGGRPAFALRSKSPELAMQELWGRLLAQFAVQRMTLSM